MDTENLITLALMRTCPAGEPWTGDHPEDDHGHTDCFVIHELVKTIRDLQAQNAEFAELLMGSYVSVHESVVSRVDELLATHIGGGAKRDVPGGLKDRWLGLI